MEASGVLLTADEQQEASCYVEPSSLLEVAELVRCDVGDLTFLPYGENNRSVMWMSRSSQVDVDVPLNKGAMVVVQRIHGLPMAVRGSVVAFPHGMKFDERFPYAPPTAPRGGKSKPKRARAQA